jgi:hypothetical protein
MRARVEKLVAKGRRRGQWRRDVEAAVVAGVNDGD